MVSKFYTVNAKRNRFKEPWTHHLTTKFGKATPILCQEFKPGDSYLYKINQFMRMLPLVAPTMSNIKARIDFFRVDNHMIFDQWDDYIKQVGSEQSPIVHPYITIPSGGFDESSLADYFGVKPGKGAGMKISALPFRAYHLVCNKYYINSNLQDEVVISKSAGADVTTSTTLRECNWRRDRFGNAETTRQRGGDVILPIGQSAPVVSTGDNPLYSNGTSEGNLVSDSNQGYRTLVSSSGTPLTGTFKFGSETGLEADLSSATGVSLPALSMAKTLQHLREVSLFAGEHYSDWQFANWGVRSSDARLQEPSWLGGMKWDFITSEVLQTSQSTDSSVQGTMAGHGFSTGNGKLYIPYLNSYGFIIAILTVMPEPEYQDGIDKMFLRDSNFDYALPLLSHMPMQEIQNCELYLQDETVLDSDGNVVNHQPFGYEPIYEEYRTKLNRTSGAFRSSLSHWLTNRIFDSLPALNENFVKASSVPDGIFAVDPDTVDPLLCDFRIQQVVLQKLPKIGIPIF